MAAETNYQPTSDVKVYLGTEATFGTATLAAGTWDLLPVTSYSLPEVSAPAEISTQRSGKFTNFSNQATHRPDQKLYTFDLTFKGTTTSVLRACRLMFEDGVSECDFTGDYEFPTSSYKDAESSTTQMTVLFQNAGADATSSDLICKSCVATGMTLAEDIGSEGGELTVSLNMVTAYQPTHGSLTPSSSTEDTATPKNIKSITTAYINGGAQEDLVIMGWEVAFSRTIERIHFKDTTNYDPYGLAMTGALEATGNINCKRDDAVHDLLAKFKDGNTVAVSLAEASNFTIDIPKAIINEASVDSGGSYLKQAIPFTALGNEATTSDSIVGITIA